MQHSYKSTLYRHLAGCLIRLYPAPWRERYAEEMLLILDDSAPTFTTILNLFFSLLDAHIHHNLIEGRAPYMLQKLRFNGLTIYSASLIFFTAWYVVQRHIGIPDQPESLFSGFSYQSSSLLVNIVHSISYILLLLILLGGLPILLAACWKAVKARNLRALLLCLVALISPLVAPFLMMMFVSFFEMGIIQGGAYPELLLFGLFFGLYISLALIFFAVQRVAPSRLVTHYVLYLATLLPLVMLVGLAALPFGLLPSIAASFTAPRETSYIIRLGLLTLVMLVTFALSIISLKKAFQAKQAEKFLPHEEAAMVQ
ncbi:MAG TPA: hypothetical protein VHZ51_26710 [Ktedonobacteraceae bacterium]|jgi:hypothetical protein|nr:hypothetical protein [Ktedonobacteraceae bacterium]